MRPLEAKPLVRFELNPYVVCSFCEDLAGTRECAVVAENEHAMAEIDERQYERGAMLVIPKKHRESILEIEASEIEAVYSLVREVARGATAAFGALRQQGRATRAALPRSRGAAVQSQ